MREQDSTLTIKELTSAYAREGVTFAQGRGGLPLVCLQNAEQSAEIYLHGASATSWRSADGAERLFLSERAIFAPLKPIRGGIPLVFPQFGPGALPSHGFARDRPWRVVASASNGQQRSVTFELVTSGETRIIWPFEFRSRLTFSLGSKLSVELVIENLDSKPISFQWAFHTYFLVSDIATTTVRGFEGLTYLDNLANKRASIDARTTASIAEEVDRIYCRAPDKIDIFDRGAELVSIEKHGLPDAVLWNPWIEKSKRIADLSAEDFRRFVCVECGVIEKPQVLSPGSGFTASMVLASRQVQRAG